MFKYVSNLINKLRNRKYIDSLDDVFIYRDSEKTSLNKSIGEKIIYCPNTWQDPIFAVILTVNNVNDQVYFLIRNVLTDEKSIITLGSFFYTNELLTLSILKLNPFERWNLAIGRLSINHYKWIRNKDSEITNSLSLENELRRNNFLFSDKKLSDQLCYISNNFINPDYEFKRDGDYIYCIIRHKTHYNIQTEILVTQSKKEAKEIKQILNLA